MGFIVGAFIIYMFIGMVLSWEDYCRNKYDDDDYDD